MHTNLSGLGRTHAAGGEWHAQPLWESLEAPKMTTHGHHVAQGPQPMPERRKRIPEEGVTAAFSAAKAGDKPECVDEEVWSMCTRCPSDTRREEDWHPQHGDPEDQVLRESSQARRATGLRGPRGEVQPRALERPQQPVATTGRGVGRALWGDGEACGLL